MIKVRVELKETSQAIELNAVNAYTKGVFYCVFTEDRVVHKYPLANIWRVIEDYS
jgi:hypothetical protein